MMRRVAAVAVIVGMIVAGWAARLTSAQDAPSEMAGHQLVGSWLVAVEVEGQPPLRLPNLASFTADGIVVVAAPTLLPELPGGAAPRDVFSAGHGAWTPDGAEGAEVRFVFLVVDEQGNPASINLVDGQLAVDADGNAYSGEFTLTVVSAQGDSPAPVSGTWQATRIAAGAAMDVPLDMDGMATPAMTEPAATPAA